LGLCGGLNERPAFIVHAEIPLGGLAGRWSATTTLYFFSLSHDGYFMTTQIFCQSVDFMGGQVFAGPVEYKRVKKNPVATRQGRGGAELQPAFA
jgi:hypothetical protein